MPTGPGNLPGYDAWLDNHGDPAPGAAFPDPENPITGMTPGPVGSEDCQAAHCPPGQFVDCAWPTCALQLDRNTEQPENR